MRAYFYNIAVILFFLLTSSECDFECFELKQNTRYNLDLYVVEATPDDYSNFETIRKLSFNRIRKYPSLTTDIADNNILSDDNNVVITEKGIHFSLINFSPASHSPEIFNSSDIITVTEPNLVTFHHFDYVPHQQKIIRTFYDGVEVSGVYISEYAYINSVNPFGSEEDTLKMIHSEVIGDSIFTEKKIIQLRYDSNSDATFFVLMQRNMPYNPSSGLIYDWPLSETPKYFMMKMDNTNTLDTLFTLPEAIAYSPPMNIYGESFFLNINGSLRMYDKSGNVIRTIEGVVQPHFSSSGNSFTYNNYKMYYNIVEDYSVDLSQYVSDIIFAQPNEDFILIMEENLSLHIFSIEQSKVIQTVGFANMPYIEQRRDKVSQLGMYFPVLTEDKRIRMIFTERFYKDEPDDGCVI